MSGTNKGKGRERTHDRWPSRPSTDPPSNMQAPTDNPTQPPSLLKFIEYDDNPAMPRTVQPPAEDTGSHHPEEQKKPARFVVITPESFSKTGRVEQGHASEVTAEIGGMFYTSYPDLAEEDEEDEGEGQQARKRRRTSSSPLAADVIRSPITATTISEGSMPSSTVSEADYSDESEETEKLIKASEERQEEQKGDSLSATLLSHSLDTIKQLKRGQEKWRRRRDKEGRQQQHEQKHEHEQRRELCRAPSPPLLEFPTLALPSASSWGAHQLGQQQPRQEEKEDEEETGEMTRMCVTIGCGGTYWMELGGKCWRCAHLQPLREQEEDEFGYEDKEHQEMRGG